MAAGLASIPQSSEIALALSKRCVAGSQTVTPSKKSSIGVLSRRFDGTHRNVSRGSSSPTSLLPGAVRRHFGAIPADRSAAKTPVVRFRAIVKPQNALLAGALADEIKVDIGQQISDGLGNGSEELFRHTWGRGPTPVP